MTRPLMYEYEDPWHCAPDFERTQCRRQVERTKEFKGQGPAHCSRPERSTSWRSRCTPRTRSGRRTGRPTPSPPHWERCRRSARSIPRSARKRPERVGSQLVPRLALRGIPAEYRCKRSVPLNVHIQPPHHAATLSDPKPSHMEPERRILRIQFPGDPKFALRRLV